MAVKTIFFVQTAQLRNSGELCDLDILTDKHYGHLGTNETIVRENLIGRSMEFEQFSHLIFINAYVTAVHKIWRI